MISRGMGLAAYVFMILRGIKPRAFSILSLGGLVAFAACATGTEETEAPVQAAPDTPADSPVSTEETVERLPPDSTPNDLEPHLGSDQPTGNGGSYPTRNSNVRLLGGYHSLFDKTMNSPCVQSVSGENRYVVGDSSGSMTVTYVTDRNELARELGVDLGLQVRYGLTNVEGDLSMVETFSQTTTTASFLLKVDHTYSVLNQEDLELTDEASDALRRGPEDFVRLCGTNFINGVTYGAQMVMLITFKATDQTTAREMKTQLGVGTNVGVADVGGNIGTKMAMAASMSGVNVQVRTERMGFDLDYDSSAFFDSIVNAGVSGDLLKEIDDIRRQLDASVQSDVCEDAGDSECRGSGYFENTHRQARPIAVDIGFYDGLPNAFWYGDESPFGQIRDRLAHVERFVRDYSEILIRYRDLYANEVAPFLEASSAQKANYNVAPPGAYRRTIADLTDLAESLDAQYYPPSTAIVGWSTQRVVERIRNCWDLAAINLFESCTADDVALTGTSDNDELEATDTVEWQELYGALQTYDDSQRILPLDFIVLPYAYRYEVAAQQCEAYSNSSVRYRLPTRDEVLLLAPFIGFGTANWSYADAPHQVWYDQASDTTCNEAFPYPIFKNEPSATSAWYTCSAERTWWGDSEDQLAAVCVPSSGPIPYIPAI